MRGFQGKSEVIIQKEIQKKRWKIEEENKGILPEGITSEKNETQEKDKI